jgi:Amt family ammonium transporter
MAPMEMGGTVFSGTVRGLFYGDASQFTAEFIGVLTNFITIGLISYVIFKLIGMGVGNRVSANTEMEGLDVPEMELKLM